MLLHFHKDGLRFVYPDNWRLEREEVGNGWTVTVQSPATAFLMISFDADMPEIEDMAQAALEALLTEYPDLEVDDRVETFAGQPAFGHDIRFFKFDLTNTCETRSFYSSRGTVLVLWQLNDLELDTNEPVLRAMCASLQIEDEE